MLSEINHSEKDKYHMISLIGEFFFKANKKREYFFKRLTNTENKPVFVRRDVGGNG